MKENQIQIPKFIREKAEAAKRYIEKKYSMNYIKAEERAENWKSFTQRLKNMQLSPAQQNLIKNQVLHEQMQQCRRKRQKISKKNFESIKVIGRGAFGEVRLCKQIKTGRIVAIKSLKKKEMIKKNQQMHLRDERDILADGSEWIVKLLYSFQDQANLFLVMEYLPGGDLMTLLIQRNVINESEARFYVAQTIVAMDNVHKLGFIHRDLKPDNILIDRQGHIKLSDFGLCKQSQQLLSDDKDNLYSHRRYDFKNLKKDKLKYEYHDMIDFKKKNRKLAYSAVGTPDYIAPQMLTRRGYSQIVDWWSIGIMLYEMLIGYAPFSSDNNEEIYYKIQNHEEFLHFPVEVDLSEEVIDLISRLLTDEKVRLGKNGVVEIQKHAWFKNIDWRNIRKLSPPFIPQMKNEIDTRYFDSYEEKQPWVYNPIDPSIKKDFNFIGYTFKEEDQQKPVNQVFEKALEKAEAEKQQQCRREREWMEQMRTKMKKKKILQVDVSANKTNKEKTVDKTFYTNKSELHTQRSRQQLKSKSPLGERENNLRNLKKVSKSPVRNTTTTSTTRLAQQKSSNYLKKPQITYSSTIFHQTQNLSTIVGRKSLNTRK